MGILMFVLLIGTTVFGDEGVPTAIVGNDGAPMVFVPAGEFIMGPPGAEKTSYLKDYYIDKYEVTVEQFKKFVKETGYITTAERVGYTQDPRGKYPGYTWRDPHYRTYGDKFPVTCVSPADAEAYAKWAGKRLPTWEEWEKAARGTDGRKYPWGNNLPVFKKMGNYKNRMSEVEEVGSYPAGASPYGCLDMIGNLWEFVQIEPSVYCQRGGSFNTGSGPPEPSGDEGLTTYFSRWRFGRNFTSKHCTTFRCVKDVEQEKKK